MASKIYPNTRISYLVSIFILMQIMCHKLCQKKQKPAFPLIARKTGSKFFITFVNIFEIPVYEYKI